MTDQETDENSVELLPIPAIQKRILAELYGVETKRLIQQVKRNMARFPEDFMFQLTSQEAAALRSHFATSKGRGGRRYSPYVFTEQGVAMLSSVLRSRTAITVNTTSSLPTSSRRCDN